MELKNYHIDILNQLLQGKRFALISSRRIKKDNTLYTYQVVLLATVMFQMKRWSR